MTAGEPTNPFDTPWPGLHARYRGVDHDDLSDDSGVCNGGRYCLAEEVVLVKVTAIPAEETSNLSEIRQVL